MTSYMSWQTDYLLDPDYGDVEIECHKLEEEPVGRLYADASILGTRSSYIRTSIKILLTG